jgi:TPR repeat protein
MKRLYLGFILALVGMGVARADFNDGVVAYLMGDYEHAFTTMQALAETSDHGYAQYYMGIMYKKGQGVEQDYKLAGEWFRKAAENRIPQAQFKLGELYMKGLGVPRDYEFAYVWFSVGAEHKHDKSVNTVSKAMEKLSREELAEANKLATNYIEKYGPEKGVDPTKPVKIDNE